MTVTIETLSQTDGWKTFPTEQEALDYCDLTWAAILYVMPDERIPTEVLALFAAFLIVVSDAGGDVRAVPGDVIRSVSVVPFLGLNHVGEVVYQGGESRAWAVPRKTVDAQWAVPCLAGFDAGGPEPEWPSPAPVLVSLLPTNSPVGQTVTISVACDPLAGALFTAASLIQADGVALPTVFVNATMLTVTGTPLAPDTFEVTVRDGTYVSNALTYTVTGP